MRGLALAALFALGSALAAPLTNLSHLDFLTDTLTPPEQEGHTTYRPERPLRVLWTYAEPTEAGAYRWVGGGAYDSDTDTWSQGAYNTDDLTRAAVVYVRAWRQLGDARARDHAFDLLRAVAYMQTLTPGPREGNPVLWMQPDGRLNPSAEPVELPDPSDSGPSFWLARTLWALGEGYEAFRDDDPAFAAFLEERLLLALGALERQVLVHYPTTEALHGFPTPTWLINYGADSASEAIYGLAAYARAGGGERAERALRALAEGVALMQTQETTAWPFGATLPWARSRSLWHGWGAQMAGALAVAGEVLEEPRFTALARHEASTFVPLLLTYGGADQAWTPTPSDTVQIAYGADAVLQNLLAVARATDEAVFEQLAGVAGAWFFGNNRAGEPMYDPQTGRTFDGLEPDGRINRNAGAESTIHGLLSMLALDAHPELRARARTLRRVHHDAWALLEAEVGTVAGDAAVQTPESAWNGEALWSGGSYLTLEPGARVTLGATLERGGRYVALPVFLQQPVNRFAVGTRLSAAGGSFGTVWHGGAGEPGLSENEGFVSVARAPYAVALGAGLADITVEQVGGVPAQLDAVLLRPEVARLELRGAALGVTLLHSWAPTRRVAVVRFGEGAATAYVYSRDGRLAETVTGTEGELRVPVAAGGFAYVLTP
ncbi:hypothetical protein [Truepera radiovictrix]|uniref:hypothetical protein n=1 Tax=Truepera radiovictrix TaxID=332249 RepID=UPI0003193515|nr:hypothetical protein [Truepera radiovictrix]WMT56503.1 hypothetical protein RCV51_10875 [Truepera radiovictrix]